MPMLHSAEYVFPGHPDKLCDAIADALVQEASRLEKRALCGIEVAIHRSTVYITGRIACRDAPSIPIATIARDVLKSAGYGSGWIPDPNTVLVETNLCLGELDAEESDFRVISDDQSVVTGYAIDSPGTNYLPPEHWLAWRLSQALASLRMTRPELELGPDGKVIVVYEEDGKESRIKCFSTSLQQRTSGPSIELHRAVTEALRSILADAAKAIPGFNPSLPEQILINGAGSFDVGGPEGDNGLSGKKLVVDAYGPHVPIGGGALSGKDFFKADRAGAIIARRLAKLVVLTDAAKECTVKLTILPGAEQAEIISLHDGLNNDLNCERWSQLIDLKLESVGERYTDTADLVDIARYGHFTRADISWERLTKN